MRLESRSSETDRGEFSLRGRVENELGMVFRRSFIFVGTMLAVCAVGMFPSAYANNIEPFDYSEQQVASFELVYVSDYVSFVGTDSQGHVAFAIDNNRGKDGKTYQAEHFLVLHDEQQGWVPLAGNGAYDNNKRELLSIPNSSNFVFQGLPRTGLTIRSATNQLTLKISPIEGHISRSHDGSRLWMGSAPGTLEWKGRLLKGRVIYEYLLIPNFNRLTKTYFGLWKEFQGFYLSVDGEGDFYLHSQQSEKFAPLLKELAGFSIFEGKPDQLDAINFTIQDKDFALGLYRWPTKWNIAWKGSKGAARMDLQLTDRKVLGNWGIGGFAMGIVQGNISYAGREWPYYGLVELLM